MTEPRDPRIRAAMVELGAASREAPAWEQIEAESAGPGRAPAPSTPRPRRWAAAIRRVMGRRLPRPDEDSVPAVGSGSAGAAKPDSNVTGRGGLLIAATAMAAALVIALPLMLLRRGGESPVVAANETTLVAASTTAGTTAPTTATILPRMVAAPIPAADASPSGGLLVALSAGEAWTVMGASDPDGDSGLSLIGHLEDGSWALWHLTGTDPASIRGLAAAPDGTVWTATAAGVFSFDGEAWTRRFDGFAAGVTVADDGTVWIGGSPDPNGGWLARWDGQSWERVESPVGPGGAGWTEMAVSPEGEVWATVRSYGCITSPLMRYDGATLQAIPVADRRFGGSYVSAIEVAPNGDLWVGGFLGGDPAASVNGVRGWTEPVMLARFDGEAWTLYDWPLPNPIIDCSVPLLDMAAGPDGVLWLAYRGGLGSFDGTKGTLHLPIEGAGAEQWVTSVDVAPDGTVWYADSEGLHTLSSP